MSVDFQELRRTALLATALDRKKAPYERLQAVDELAALEGAPTNDTMIVTDDDLRRFEDTFLYDKVTSILMDPAECVEQNPCCARLLGMLKDRIASLEEQAGIPEEARWVDELTWYRRYEERTKRLGLWP